VLGRLDRGRKACGDDYTNARAGHQQTAGRIPLGEADQPPVEHGNLLTHGVPSGEEWINDGSQRGAPLEELPHPDRKAVACSLAGHEAEGLQDAADLVIFPRIGGRL
jgi:hypothetical protein